MPKGEVHRDASILGHNRRIIEIAGGLKVENRLGKSS
jgi:hypothetical protein